MREVRNAHKVLNRMRAKKTIWKEKKNIGMNRKTLNCILKTKQKQKRSQRMGWIYLAKMIDEWWALKVSW
jgi:hypothetical protein